MHKTKHLFLIKKRERKKMVGDTRNCWKLKTSGREHRIIKDSFVIVDEGLLDAYGNCVIEWRDTGQNMELWDRIENCRTEQGIVGDSGEW